MNTVPSSASAATAASAASASLRAQANLVTILGSTEPLATLLDALVRYVETWLPDVRCSVLIADHAAGVLRLSAAPMLPAAYHQAIGPVAIAEGNGSCGTAAARREMVITADIERAPLWKQFAREAREHRLRACWSVPIIAGNDLVLGTFAMYYGAVREPAPADRDLLAFAASLAAIVIQRHGDLERLRLSEDRYRCLAETCADAILIHSGGSLRYANRAAAALLGLPRSGDLDPVPLADFLAPTCAASLLAQHDGVQTARLRRADGSTVVVEVSAADSIDLSHGTTVLVCRDLTERIELEQAVLDTADEERERLAYELHDGLCQELAGISMLLGTMPAGEASSAAAAALAEVKALVSKALATARALATGMSAIAVQRSGLVGALEMLVAGTQALQRTPLRLRVNVAGMEPLELACANHLFRIAQEAVSNAARHAGASAIEVSLLWSSPNLQLTVADDGRGMAARPYDEQGLGLRAMRYRADRIGAAISFETRRPHGTLVRVVLPQSAAAAEARAQTA